MAREQVLTLKKDDKLVTPIERKKRKDFVRNKLKPYVYDYLTDNCYTRIDTNQGSVEIIDPRTGDVISEHRRIWCNVNKQQQHLLFLKSDHYSNFQQDHDGATATSIGVWEEVLGEVGSFVSNSRPQSCVDEKTSAMEHFMAALLGYIKKPHVQTYLEGYHDNGEGLLYDGLVGVL